MFSVGPNRNFYIKNNNPVVLFKIVRTLCTGVRVVSFFSFFRSRTARGGMMLRERYTRVTFVLDFPRQKNPRKPRHRPAATASLASTPEGRCAVQSDATNAVDRGAPRQVPRPVSAGGSAAARASRPPSPCAAFREKLRASSTKVSARKWFGISSSRRRR